MTLRASTLALALGMAAAGVAHAQPVAPNPGGTVVTTNSTTTSYLVRDIPVTQTIDDYSTTLTAVLNGNQTVFSQTYALPFSDPAVQAGVAAADAILAADHAYAVAPALTSMATVLESGRVMVGPAAPTNILTGFTVSGTVDTFGPNVIRVGDNQSELFYISSGQLDINVNTDFQFYSDATATTTNTDLTTAQYLISGLVGAAPEPSTWALMMVGVGLIGGVLRRAPRFRGIA